MKDLDFIYKFQLFPATLRFWWTREDKAVSDIGTLHLAPYLKKKDQVCFRILRNEDLTKVERIDYRIERREKDKSKCRLKGSGGVRRNDPNIDFLIKRR